VKYFGKHFEEFRRDMHYYKEIVFSDMLTSYGNGLPENKERQSLKNAASDSINS